VLEHLVKYIDAVQGAIYLYNEESDTLANLSTYAYNRKKYITQEFKVGHGLIGQCAYEKDHIYRTEIPDDYFTTRGEVNISLAQSILAYDMHARTTSELVKPEGSFAIYSPNWSPDGRYLAFEEVSTYEGSGDFAYYDFETMIYHTWGEAIGLYDWSADSNQIIYDRMTYTATGEERIYIRPLTGGEEQMISVNLSKGYAFAPAYSPLGDQVAYFVHNGEVDGEVFDLYIQNLSGGDPLVVGEFTSAQPMVWSSDGSLLFFSSGPYESQQISAVSVADGSISLVAQGTSPVVATIVK